jgi:hypothetical protein
VHLIKRLRIGEEIDCDRVRMTQDAVYARINGFWIEVRPPEWEENRERATAKGG